MFGIENIKRNREVHWYAIYTKPRWEKRLQKDYTEQGVETYLPLVTKIQQWSDRKKKIQTPLISSYIFVRTNYAGYCQALRLDGAIKGVIYDGRPAIIKDEHIESLKIILKEKDVDVRVDMRTFIPGATVRVKAGPFEGATGKLLHSKGKNSLCINLSHLRMNICVDINAKLVEVVGSCEEVKV